MVTIAILMGLGRQATGRQSICVPGSLTEVLSKRMEDLEFW